MYSLSCVCVHVIDGPRFKKFYEYLKKYFVAKQKTAWFCYEGSSDEFCTSFEALLVLFSEPFRIVPAQRQKKTG